MEREEEINANGKDYPYIITTNRELEHYNAGTMTRRTRNVQILTEDTLMIHPMMLQPTVSPMVIWSVWKVRGKVDIKARITDEVRQEC